MQFVVKETDEVVVQPSNSPGIVIETLKAFLKTFPKNHIASNVAGHVCVG